MKVQSRPYANPYLAGFALGLLLLFTYYVSGHGLGASGAMKNLLLIAIQKISPSFAEAKSFFRQLSPNEALTSWVLIMFFGVMLGGFLSGAISGRLQFRIDRGPRLSVAQRLALAFIGGILFGIGAQLARGCTSGAALSGMAVLSTSGIISMMAIFGTAFAIAYFFRKLWL